MREGRRFAPPPRPDITVDAKKAAKPKKRKAVAAWASVQRFDLSAAPFVMPLFFR